MTSPLHASFTHSQVTIETTRSWGKQGARCWLSPGTPDHEETLAAVELLATEVGPRIGWIPATAAVPVG